MTTPDHTGTRTLQRVFVAMAFVALTTLIACATPEPPWPTEVVSIDRMRTTSPLRAQVLTKSPDKSRTSSVVLHVHVDAEGRTVRSRIEQSSGNPRVDEAALQSMRNARFEPWLVGGVPQAVTVVAPMTFPFQDRR